MKDFVEILNTVYGVAQMMMAVLIFLFWMKKRSFFIARLAASVAVQILFVRVVPVFDFGYFLQSVYLMAIFMSIVLNMWFCFEGSFFEILFCCISGRCMQGIARNTVALVGDFSLSTDTWISILIYALIYALFYFLFARRLNLNQCGNVSNRKITLMAFAVLFVTIVLNLLSQGAQTDVLGAVCIHTLVIITCLLLLFLQFGIMAEETSTQVIQTIKYLQHKEMEQYEISRETMDLINVKYHDLKKLLAGYEGMFSKEELIEVSKSIDIFSSLYRTGNRIFDTVFTEKALICDSKDIRLECILDVSGFESIDSVDLFSLLSNSLNNAIEASAKVEDPEKRRIWVKSASRGELLFLSVQNYFDGKLKFCGDGLFKTTKRDEKYHGFGLKSMKMVAEKYNGSMSVKTENNIFSLNFVLSK